MNRVKLTSYGLTVDRLNAADRSGVKFPAFILAALLSFGTVQASETEAGAALQSVFHTEAALFTLNYRDQSTMAKLQECTDKILLSLSGMWSEIASDYGVTENNAHMAASSARTVFRNKCLNGTGS